MQNLSENYRQNLGDLIRIQMLFNWQKRGCDLELQNFLLPQGTMVAHLH